MIMIVKRDYLVLKFMRYLTENTCICNNDLEDVFRHYLNGMKEIQKYDR